LFLLSSLSPAWLSEFDPVIQPHAGRNRQRHTAESAKKFHRQLAKVDILTPFQARGGPPDRRSFAATVDPTDARKLVRRSEEPVGFYSPAQSRIVVDLEVKARVAPRRSVGFNCINGTPAAPPKTLKLTIRAFMTIGYDAIARPMTNVLEPAVVRCRCQPPPR
jgi:hypothetical protein